MRLYLLSLVLFMSLNACNGQTTGYSKAKEVKKAIEDAPRPGTMQTTMGGWTMTAKVNGKQWTASSIMPPAAAGRIVGYAGSDSYIGLPAFEKRLAKVGNRNTIGEDNAADIWIKGDNTSYTNYTGTVEITKITGDWVEGTFYFSAPSPTKKLTVTEGFFRVQL